MSTYTIAIGGAVAHEHLSRAQALEIVDERDGVRWRNPDASLDPMAIYVETSSGLVETCDCDRQLTPGKCAFCLD
jgi:hypothetical protein